MFLRPLSIGAASLLAFAGALFGLSAVHHSLQPRPVMQKRWLFFWRDLSDPKEVDRMLAKFPRAKADGYNGVAFSYNVPADMAPKIREAANSNGLDIVAIVMGGTHDKNYEEGLKSRDALFIAHNGIATHQPDNPTTVVNGDFESFSDNHFKGWGFQDDEGVTTFVDREVKHGGNASLRMQDVGKNDARHCRIMQPIKLQPFRQYRISFWIKTQDLAPTDPEVKILTADAKYSISFQTFHVEPTQDWKEINLVFNSMENSAGNLYLGSWYGKNGKMWWDDLKIEEIALVNVLRRPGCPVTVRADSGDKYEEGKDYQRIVDPNLHPWIAYHEAPNIKLTAGTRIREGERLRVSYYHPIIIYEDRVTSCLSEPKIFEEWEQEVRTANATLHPAAFFMSHDELRVINRCALCQSKGMTAGQLLAWNVHKAAGIIRTIRPDAEIWVWNDMFDPMHNAVDHFYAVKGTLEGSWKGLDKDVGIVNWHGGLKGKNCAFFANLGLKQILSGYYDGDEQGDDIAQWIDNAKGTPGVVGAMYTTWEDKYGAMDVWAKRAWGGKEGKLPK